MSHSLVSIVNTRCNCINLISVKINSMYIVQLIKTPLIIIDHIDLPQIGVHTHMHMQTRRKNCC